MSVVRANDLVRADDFRRVGLEVLELVGADVMDHARLVRRIQEARRRALAARAVAAGPPRWTLRAPPWWIHTHTVERRRALTPDQAERLLRYRLPGSRRAA